MRLSLAIAAALLASVATSADAKSPRHADPKPPVAQCTTDTECERLHGPGNWFPQRQRLSPAPEATVGARRWFLDTNRPISTIPQHRIMRWS
jgi:hypothetical protein